MSKQFVAWQEGVCGDCGSFSVAATHKYQLFVSMNSSPYSQMGEGDGVGGTYDGQSVSGMEWNGQLASHFFSNSTITMELPEPDDDSIECLSITQPSTTTKPSSCIWEKQFKHQMKYFLPVPRRRNINW